MFTVKIDYYMILLYIYQNKMHTQEVAKQSSWRSFNPGIINSSYLFIRVTAASQNPRDTVQTDCSVRDCSFVSSAGFVSALCMLSQSGLSVKMSSNLPLLLGWNGPGLLVWQCSDSVQRSFSFAICAQYFTVTMIKEQNGRLKKSWFLTPLYRSKETCLFFPLLFILEWSCLIML